MRRILSTIILSITCVIVILMSPITFAEETKPVAEKVISASAVLEETKPVAEKVISASALLEEAKQDPAKIKGPTACAECHEEAAEVLTNTHHATSFKKMPRSKEAKAIAKKMKVRRIKTNELCSTCHFTLKQRKKGKRLKPVAGTSCESCHNAGADWIDIHADYGGKNTKREQETASHKAKRLADSEKAGMIRPDNAYELYRRCFSCHTVRQEALVNETDHAAGSDFELVSWSNGEIRHNFFRGKGGANPEDSAKRKAFKYVLGQMLDLEFALRGLAQATKAGRYEQALSKRANKALEKLTTIEATQSIPEVKTLLDTMKNIKISWDKKEDLNKAVMIVTAQSKAFGETWDKGDYHSLGKLLPSSSQYKGKPQR